MSSESLVWDESDISSNSIVVSPRSNSLESLIERNLSGILDELYSDEEVDSEESDKEEKPAFASAESTPVKPKFLVEKRTNSVDDLIKIYEPKVDSPLQSTRSNSRALTSEEIEFHYIQKPSESTNPSRAKQSKSNLGKMSLTTKDKFENLEATYDSQKEFAQTLTETIETLVNKVERTSADKTNLKKKYNTLKQVQNDMTSDVGHLKRFRLELQKNDAYFDKCKKLAQDYQELGGDINTTLLEAKNVIDALQKDTIIVDAERMQIPEFDGSIIEYKQFKTSFLKITASMGQENKRQRLMRALHGEAREKCGELIIGDKSYEDFWKTLDSLYGNPRALTDALVGDLFSLNAPSSNLQDVSKHFYSFKNKSANVTDLGHSVEELLVAYYLWGLPEDVRAKIEHELRPLKQSKYSFEDVTSAIEVVVP